VFGQNHLCVTMLHRDSTIQKCFRVRRFSVPYQPSGRSSHPVRTPICHFSLRPDEVPYRRTLDRPSIIRLDDVSLRPDPPLCREGSIQLAYVWMFQQYVRTPLSTRSVSDFFPSSKKGKIDQPFGGCGTTVRTMCHPVRTRLLNRKDFLAKFSENLVAQLSVWTAPRYIFPDAHLSPQPINRGLWALRTARIRY